MNALGGRPRLDGLHLALIHTDAIRRSHHILEESHLIREKGALLKVAKEILFLKYLYDLGSWIWCSSSLLL